MSKNMKWGSKDITPLRRDDNTLFGYKCKVCGRHWKIYQNMYHTGDCEYK